MFAKEFMKNQVQELTEKNGILVDVRTKEEFEEGHLPGALNIPMEEAEDRFEDECPDKERFYGLYCHSGGRSEVVTEFLQSIGYVNAKNIGGVISWSGPLVKNK